MSTDMSYPPMRGKSFARRSKPSTRICSREQRSVITMSSPEVCWPVPMRAIGAQNLLTMPGGVSKSGYLHKKGGSQFSLMKWPLRYVIIHKGCVYYFKSSTSAAPQGAFSLNGYNRVMRAAEETTSNNVFPFKIVHFSKKHRTWLLSAASEDERRKWMRQLRREIDHYNEREESHIHSDPDSDADSFYGTIERPMDITHHDSNADDDYVEEDDDDDEEDYLQPDANYSPPATGRPTGPPPSYPPPPVPAVFHFRQDSGLSVHKGPPPPVPPQHRNPTAPLPKRPPPAFPPPIVLKDPKRGPPPPPMPFTSHLRRPFSTNSPPPTPPPNPKRTPPPPLSKPSRSPPLHIPPPAGEPGNSKREWRPLSTLSNQSASTLPICEQLEKRLVPNGPAHCSVNVLGSQSLGYNHPRNKPTLLTHPPATRHGTSDSLSPGPTPPCHPPLSGPPPIPPLHNKPGATKPPPPAVRPPTPIAKSKPPGTSLQRASPEGQSFRSSGDETPSGFRWKPDRAKAEDDSDDDYENVQLPDSVFIDTTETCFVEKLFREGPEPPEDGLYGIRNSGTKTSKVLVVWDGGLGKARNYRLFADEDLIFLDSEVTFPSLSILIEHYHTHPLPHHGSLVLQKPFTRPVGYKQSAELGPLSRLTLSQAAS